MPRKVTNVCPKCGAWGCKFSNVEKLLVACAACGHEWKTKSRSAKRRARRLLSNPSIDAR